MSELLNTLAFVFKRAGGAKLTRQDFANVVSLDLRWFPPKEAKRLLAVGIDHRLVEEDEDVVVPRFDPAAIDVPVGFRPTSTVFEEPASVVQEEGFLAEIARAAGLDADVLRQEAEKEQERDPHLNLEAAAIVAAARRKADVADLARRARDRLARRPTTERDR